MVWFCNQRRTLASRWKSSVLQLHSIRCPGQCGRPETTSHCVFVWMAFLVGFPGASRDRREAVARGDEMASTLSHVSRLICGKMFSDCSLTSRQWSESIVALISITAFTVASFGALLPCDSSARYSSTAACTSPTVAESSRSNSWPTQRHVASIDSCGFARQPS